MMSLLNPTLMKQELNVNYGKIDVISSWSRNELILIGIHMCVHFKKSILYKVTSFYLFFHRRAKKIYFSPHLYIWKKNLQWTMSFIYNYSWLYVYMQSIKILE